MTPRWSAVAVLTAASLTAVSCGGRSPASPTPPQSFLSGTWRGTLTIQPDPTGPQPGQPITGPVTWTFETVPQTNLQTFSATIRSENAWLPITIAGSAALTPTNTPPAQISSQGQYDSPRGCRGTFGSFGTATATSIQATFTGVDCPVTFTGSVTLTKE